MQINFDETQGRIVHRVIYFLYFSDENINSTNYVLSPVKSILPAALMSRRNAHGTPNNSQMLLAYNESPLLKRNKSINANQHYLSNK